MGILLLVLGCESPVGADVGLPVHACLAPSSSVSDLGFYWRSPTELWVSDRRTRVGMNVHFHSWKGIDSDLGMLSRLDVPVARTTLYWTLAEGSQRQDGTLESDPGRDLHTHYDNFKTAARRASEAGIEVLVILHGMPHIPSDVSARLGDTDYFIERFATFVTSVIRDNPEVRLWQIWNETDAGHWAIPFGQWTGGGYDRHAQGVAYARLMKRVYTAAKEANPEAWIVMGGLTGTESFVSGGAGKEPVVSRRKSWDFLSGFYDAGGSAWYDIAAEHFYHPDPVAGLAADGLAAQLKALGDDERPLWLTEVGSSAESYVLEFGLPHETGQSDGRAFDDFQASWYLDLLMRVNRTGRYDMIFPYALFADSGLPPEEAILPPGHSPLDYGHGLLRADGVTPRPAFDRLASRGTLLDGWRRGELPFVSVTVPRGRVPLGYAYHLADPTGGGRCGEFEDAVRLTIEGVDTRAVTPARILFRSEDARVER